MAESDSPSSVALTVSPTWYGRALSAFVRAISFGTITVQTHEAPTGPPPSQGFGFASGLAQQPDFSPSVALSTFRSHPWVFAALNAKTRDLSGLPMKAYTVNSEGERQAEVTTHPLLTILERPSPGVSGRQLRKQVQLDLETTGNAFVFVAFYRGTPKEMIRYAPDRVRVIDDPQGRGVAYEIGDVFGGRAYLPLSNPDAVRGGLGGGIVHIRGASWDTGPQGVFGTGAIQPLFATLSADLATTQRQQVSAQRGRPDAIARPASGAILSPTQVAAAADAINRVFTSRDGGVAVVDGSVEVEVLGWSPRDMESAKSTASAREAVMAALGVPPTVLGLSTANYATAQEQSRTYWQGLQGVAADIEDGWSVIGSRCTQPVAIGHDFSSVGALQEDRSARLDRVSRHIGNGIPIAVAYSLEGFKDVRADMIDESAAVGGSSIESDGDRMSDRVTSPDMAAMLESIEQAITIADGLADQDAADDLVRLLEDMRGTVEAAA
jgi:HK97 family phage portal protein